jgi:hypothetical protein
MIDPGTAIALAQLATSVGSQLFGKSDKWKRVNTRSDEQISAQSQMLQQAMQGLQNPSAGFQPIADKAKQQFYSDTIPTLAERFTSMGPKGSQGGQRSSAFQGALGQAGAGLGTDLAAMEAQYGLTNKGNLLKQLGMGLEPNFENVFGGQKGGNASGVLDSLSKTLGGVGDSFGGYNKEMEGKGDFMGYLRKMLGMGNDQGSGNQGEGAAKTLSSLFSPQTGQSNFNRFLNSGGNQLGARSFSPMTGGY